MLSQGGRIRAKGAGWGAKGLQKQLVFPAKRQRKYVVEQSWHPAGLGTGGVSPSCEGGLGARIGRSEVVVLSKAAVWQSRVSRRDLFCCPVEVRGQRDKRLVALSEVAGKQNRVSGRSQICFSGLFWESSRRRGGTFTLKRNRFEAKGRAAWVCNRRGVRGEVGEQAELVLFPEVSERRSQSPKF